MVCFNPVTEPKLMRMLMVCYKSQEKYSPMLILSLDISEKESETLNPSGGKVNLWRCLLEIESAVVAPLKALPF